MVVVDGLFIYVLDDCGELSAMLGSPLLHSSQYYYLTKAVFGSGNTLGKPPTYAFIDLGI